MNTRKRQHSDSILPMRAAKHPRTARDHPNGGNSTPSQLDGISSRWCALAKDLLGLSRETLFHFIPGLGASHVETSPSSSQNVPQDSIHPFPSTPHPCHTDSQATFETNFTSLSTTRSISTPSPSEVWNNIPPKRRRSMGPTPSSPACHMDDDVMIPTPKSISPSLSFPEKPPQVDHAPAACVSPTLHQGSHVPVQLQGSMGPPPPSSRRTRSQSGKDRNIMTPPSTTAMSASTLSLMSSSSDLRNIPPFDEMMAHQTNNRFPDGIPRKYQNREHIFAKTHKTNVQATRKKDREEMVKELYTLRRNSGYISDFATFQNWLDYAARLDRLEKKGALSPSPSLIDLSRAATPTPNRRHSLPEDVNSDFLERTLEKARQALNGPKPPKPFIPSLDRLLQSARAKDEAIEHRLRLPASLPLEDEEKVDALLKKRGLVSKYAREQVTDKDISRLKPHQWLNDEIINFYGAMILGRSDECKENPGVNGGGKKKPLNVHYFSTFFWSKLTEEGYEKARLAKWTKKFDLFQKDVVLIPVNHHNSHWTGAAINFRRKRIESYDSMGAVRPNVYKLLRSYIDAEHRNKKKRPFDFSGWEDYTLQDTPQQENGFDCGVFTCQFLESLSRGEDMFNFDQTNMPYLRRRMIWEIGNATLRDGA